MRFSSEEKIIHKIKPDTKLMFIWFFTKSISHGFITAFVPTLIWVIYDLILNGNKVIFIESDGFFITIGFALFGIGSSLSYLYTRMLIKTITYYVTDRKCVWTGGIFRKVEHCASYHKITDVERSQNIIEQILKISTVSLFTPGTSSIVPAFNARTKTMPELKFEGITNSDEVAQTINEHVRKYGSSQC